MGSNKQLSIVIPTYNRADFLNYSLEVHIPLVKQYNIEICIFDNASTDNTGEIVSKWMKEYPYLSYHKNETNIGPDANFEKALKYPETDYVWLLGDTYQLPKDGISYLLELIKNKKYDAIVYNLANKLKLPTKDYVDSNLLLHDLGALMTCLACLVFSKELLNRANFSRYYNSYFIQTGIIFENIVSTNFLIHWVQTESIIGFDHLSLKKRYWSQSTQAFEIGCEAWINFVMSLPPAYKISNKMECIMDFGKVSGTFSIKNLTLMRLNGLLNLQVFNKYKKLLPLTVNYSLVFVFILAVTPKVILKFFIYLFIYIFKKDKLKSRLLIKNK